MLASVGSQKYLESSFPVDWTVCFAEGLREVAKCDKRFRFAKSHAMYLVAVQGSTTYTVAHLQADNGIGFLFAEPLGIFSLRRSKFPTTSFHSARRLLTVYGMPMARYRAQMRIARVSRNAGMPLDTTFRDRSDAHPLMLLYDSNACSVNGRTCSGSA